MTIEEKMRRVLAENKAPKDPDFERLRDFYEAKKQDGVVRKQEYTLPLIDTVGRSFYRCREDE